MAHHHILVKTPIYCSHQNSQPTVRIKLCPIYIMQGHLATYCRLFATWCLQYCSCTNVWKDIYNCKCDLSPGTVGCPKWNMEIGHSPHPGINLVAATTPICGILQTEIFWLWYYKIPFVCWVFKIHIKWYVKIPMLHNILKYRDIVVFQNTISGIIWGTSPKTDFGFLTNFFFYCVHV